MTVPPEDNRITVLRRGNSQGFTAWRPLGGHCIPNSTAGDKAQWKKAQKIETKKKTSLIINKITPIFNPVCTEEVCEPSYEPSAITSLNQKTTEPTTDNKLKTNQIPVDPWNNNTEDKAKDNKEKEQTKGHGLEFTKW